jgi:hypothetical protein
MLSTALVLVVTLAVIFAVQKVKRYRSLQSFGGHWSVGWSRLWLLRTGMSGEMNKTFTEVTNKHGELLHESGWRVPLFLNHHHIHP